MQCLVQNEVYITDELIFEILFISILYNTEIERRVLLKILIKK
jgi:hypothetical protein